MVNNNTSNRTRHPTWQPSKLTRTTMTPTTQSDCHKTSRVGNNTQHSSLALRRFDPKLRPRSYPFKIRKIWGKMSSDHPQAVPPQTYPKSTKQNSLNSLQICPRPPKCNTSIAKLNSHKFCTRPTNLIRGGGQMWPLSTPIRWVKNSQLTPSICMSMSLVRNITPPSWATKQKSSKESHQRIAPPQLPPLLNTCLNADKPPYSHWHQQLRFPIGQTWHPTPPKTPQQPTQR